MSADKITPEQLRKEAVAVERMHGETLTVDWRTKQADQLRAHAAALEELAALRAKLDGLKRIERECERLARSDAMQSELRHKAEMENAALREQLAIANKAVSNEARIKELERDAERYRSLIDATEINSDSFTWRRKEKAKSATIVAEMNAIFGMAEE